MEDRYLFKAKRLDWREFPEKEQWITGYYVLGFNEYEQPVHLIFESTSMFFSHGETDGWTEVDPSTICRCTGLKDKNGNLIWENDIVKVKYSDNFEEITEVAYTKNGYYPYSDEYECEGCCCYREVLTIEVIGNIFDNPELLENEV